MGKVCADASEPPRELPVCTTHWEKLLEELRPASVLLVGAREDFPCCLPGNVELERLDVPPCVLPRLGREFDLVLLAVRSEVLSEGSSATAWHQLVARLRDCYARELLLAVLGGEFPEGAQWHADLLGLGLRLELSCRTSDGAPVCFYRSSRGTPRPVPRWLNSRHWAHPERFGRCRW